MSTATTTAKHFTAGNGTAVHRGVTMPEGGSYTACGAEGRGYRISRLRETEAAVTCRRCKVPAEPVEPPLAESEEAQTGLCWHCGHADTDVARMVEHLMTHLVPA